MIAINETIESDNAIAGNHGYNGVLNDGWCDACLLNLNKLIMLVQYITTAPKAEMIITLSVVPVNNDNNPTNIPAINAQCGV